MNFNWHILSFCVYGFLFLVIGGKMWGNYSVFREVGCVENVKCPQVDIFEIKDQCISVVDPNGMKSIAVGGDAYCSVNEPLPRKCWTNGQRIKMSDPYVVMRNAFIIMAMFIPLYGIIFKFVHLRERHLNRNNPLPYYKSFSDELCGLWPTCIVLWVIGLITFFTYCVIVLIVILPYHIENKQVTCTSYQMKIVNGIGTIVDSVNWKYPAADGYDWTNGTTLLSSYSFQPSVLPTACWTDGTTLSFLDPTTLYIMATVILIGILVVLNVYWFTIKYIDYEISNHIHSLEHLVGANYISLGS